jgi:hypothetical protein
LFLLSLCGGAHLARIGSPGARVLTALLVLGALVAAIARGVRERRTFRDLRRMVARVLVSSDRELGSRTLRAVSLMERTERDLSAGSAELARLHFERLVAKHSADDVVRAAERHARLWRFFMFALLVALVASFAVGPMRVIEGLDVLVAYQGRAPLPLAWLDFMRVSAEPPSYLKLPPRVVPLGLGSRHPEGTLLTVHGTLRRDGRKLVLTDGEREVPFVSDGSGGVVARWPIDKSAELRVAAKFGSVLIEELERIPVTMVADASPEVRVEGAPKTVELETADDISVAYEATDDHGLRQIDVVLRAGGREDRRVLARLDGESRFERGAHVIQARDPFLKRMYLPVLVTVEAKDNDPMRGPKWGASAPITLIPPAVGGPEAERWARLTAARDELVDFLAWLMSSAKGKETKPPSAEEQEHARRATDAMRTALDKTRGGLGVPKGLRAFLSGQMKVLERPLRVGEDKIRRTEDVLLATDVVLRSLATRDAQNVAKRLADVVEEIADGARQARESEERARGMTRLDSALAASEKGAEKLAVLGVLGRDLGSVALADLGRVKRARAADDLTHVELAARHLAARLRRPNPSFGSAGRGGVESGAPAANGGENGEPSDASDRFDELASELEQLADEHAAEIAKVERSLAEAEQSVHLDALREEAKQRADALRRALADLPQYSQEPGSPRAQAALGREHGGAMAQSLERLSLGDAVQSGKDAMIALEDAERRALQASSEALDPEQVATAKRELGAQIAWAQKQLSELKRQAEARARNDMSSAGEREQGYARRAGNLASRGKHGESALPEESVESLEKAEGLMREAAKALADGRGDRGLDLQRKAQRLLEESSTGQTGDDDDGKDATPHTPRSRGDHGRDIRTGGEVPHADDSKRAEEFRKRVIEGLGTSKGGRLAPAVKRYAEGLLR